MQEIPFKGKKKAFSCEGSWTSAWAAEGACGVPLPGEEGAAPLPGLGYNLTPAKAAAAPVREIWNAF